MIKFFDSSVFNVSVPTFKLSIRQRIIKAVSVDALDLVFYTQTTFFGVDLVNIDVEITDRIVFGLLIITLIFFR